MFWWGTTSSHCQLWQLDMIDMAILDWKSSAWKKEELLVYYYYVVQFSVLVLYQRRYNFIFMLLWWCKSFCNSLATGLFKPYAFTNGKPARSINHISYYFSEAHCGMYSIWSTGVQLIGPFFFAEGLVCLYMKPDCLFLTFPLLEMMVPRRQVQCIAREHLRIITSHLFTCILAVGYE